jgi:hypothetical protein
MEPRRALAAAHSWASKPSFAEVPGVPTALPLPPCSLPRRLWVPLGISLPFALDAPSRRPREKPSGARALRPGPHRLPEGFLPKILDRIVPTDVRPGQANQSPFPRPQPGGPPTDLIAETWARGR